MKRPSFIVVAVMLCLAMAVLTIVFNIREDEHLHCECGIAQCPNEDPKVPINSNSAQMHYWSIE